MEVETSEVADTPSKTERAVQISTSEKETPQTPPSTARRKSSLTVNGRQPAAGADSDASEWTPSKAKESLEVDASDATDRLDATVREREKLRNEVTELRKSLEEIQQKHAEDTVSLHNQLEESEKSKEQSDSKYNKLLGQVNNIKTQLGERLKADAVRPVMPLYYRPIRISDNSRLNLNKLESIYRDLKKNAKLTTTSDKPLNHISPN